MFPKARLPELSILRASELSTLIKKAEEETAFALSASNIKEPFEVLICEAPPESFSCISANWSELSNLATSSVAPELA